MRSRGHFYGYVCVQAKPTSSRQLELDSKRRLSVPRCQSRLIGTLGWEHVQSHRFQSGATQLTIADFLDRETARLDVLMTEIKDTITLLKERRAALIAAVVTGQFDIGEAE